MTRGAPRRRDKRVAAIVLAAGGSRRMGNANKLLIEIGGRPIVRIAVEAVLASRVESVIVVTGHDRPRIESALQGLKVKFAYNAEYRRGLASSLRAGLGAIPAGVDGAVICLADMPLVRATHIDRLIGALDSADGHAICVPTRQGHQGNPVLWAARYFAEMAALDGDMGAKTLLAAHASAVVELEMDDDGVLVDIDTPEAAAALRAIEEG